MTRACGLVVAAVASLAGGAGCVTCRHEAYETAIEVGPLCDIPACERQKVYVFLINGLSPTGSCGLSGLRDKLTENGYAKVGYAQLVHGWWVGDEMKRIHCEDSDVRFVLVGYDLGGAVAVQLAGQARQAGLPVEAVVLLDPIGRPSPTHSGVRTLLVNSGGGRSPVPHTESVIVPDANHFNLPAHPQTVAAVCDLLNGIAASLWTPEIDTFPTWSYEHAPPVRLTPIPPATESSVLADRPGGVKVPIETHKVMVTVRKSLSPANNSAVTRKP